MVGWGVVVVATFLVVTLIAHLIRDWVREPDLSGIDRTMGLVFGALFGLGIAAFGFTLWASTRPASEVKEALAASKHRVHGEDRRGGEAALPRRRARALDAGAREPRRQ